MTYHPERHHRRSIRLRGYDYSQAGMYFATICVQDRACLLGAVVEGDVRLSHAGRVVEAAWQDLPGRFPGIDVDAFVVMPNHVHGVVVLGTDPENGDQGVTPSRDEGAMNRAPTNLIVDGQRQTGNAIDAASRVGARFIAPSSQTAASRFANPVTPNPRTNPVLGEVIRTFKAVTSRQIRLAAALPFSWQRNYYEHIIRNDRELARARAYIAANPSRWADDAENPLRPS